MTTETKPKSTTHTFKLKYENNDINETEDIFSANCIFYHVLEFIKANKAIYNKEAASVKLRVDKFLPSGTDYQLEEVLKVMRSDDAVIESSLIDSTGVVINDIDAEPIIEAMNVLGATSITILIPKSLDMLIATYCTNSSHRHNYIAVISKN